MEEIKIVFKFINNIIWGLLLEGLMSIVAGILILIYPDLLGILVGFLLIIVGIIGIGLAVKVYGYSKIKIKI